MDALLDTGANGEAFIRSELYDAIKRRLRPTIHKLKKPIQITGHHNQVTGELKRYFQVDLAIDGRRVPTWFFFCNTGRHDIILGKHWFAKTDTAIHCGTSKLIWPSEAPYDPSRKLTVPRNRLFLPEVLYAQEDADRRDALIEQEDRHLQPTRILRRNDSPYLALAEPTLAPPPTEAEGHSIRKQCNTELQASSIDIAFIGASPFIYHAKKKDTILGYTSLYEIDKLLAEHEAHGAAEEAIDTADEALIDERLPGKYREYRDVFSRKEANTIPPPREGIDHKIELTEAAVPTTSPLYQMSHEHLQLMKKYLTEHLYKGFIEPSRANYASPVLFAKKPGGGWRFCVDYRKLNAITKKDKYPLPLIDETMSRLAKAKRFTRLDIRHAFNRIRMDPDSEDLTTFRTRYGSYKYKVLPFGLCNGPSSFQRFINSILFDLLDQFVTVYIDDLLIHSEDPAEHDAHVKQVLDRLREAGL
jgi:hypothetical protein